MANITTWSPITSTTQNNDNPPNGFPEGMPAGELNNSSREVMAAVRRDWELTHGIGVTAGSGNAFTLTYTVSPGSYYTGMIVCFKANRANTGTSTLNINSLGAVTMLTNLGNALVTGDILINGFYIVVYDGVNFRFINGTAGYARYA